MALWIICGLLVPIEFVGVTYGFYHFWLKPRPAFRRKRRKYFDTRTW